MNIIYRSVLLRVVKNDLKNKIVSYKWVIILSIFFLINYLTLINIASYSKSVNLSFNIWDYILYILNNSSYYLYIYIPLSVFICIDMASSSFADISLIRYNSIVIWILNKLTSIHLNCLILVMWLLITILVTSFNITYEMGWSSFMYDTEYLFNKDILIMLHPITAVIFSIIQLVFSLSIFSVIITLGYIYINSKIFHLIPSLVLWVLTIFSSKSTKVLFKDSYIYLENIFLFSKSVNLNKFGFFIAMFFFIIVNTFIFILCKLKLKNKDLYIGNKYE